MKDRHKKWQTELANQAERYHKITAWVAIILNLLWFIGDYIEIPQYWTNFFYFRLTVSSLTLITLLSYKKLKLPSYSIVLVPVVGIAIQNAYMYSVMDVTQLQKHTFAYLALFIGAGMLVLWEIKYSIIVVVTNLLASIIFISIFSQLKLNEILINGGLLTLSVSIFMIVLIQTRYSLTKKEIIARFALQDSKKEIELKNKDITDSIIYAEKIQQAILPDKELIAKHLSDHFVLYKPRDIVCGDFYWFTHQNNKSFIVAADCTGHGVPGAFMSMIGNSLLNQIVIEKGIEKPSDILNELKKGVIRALKQSGNEGRQEGMDMALCCIDMGKQILEFSGAYNPLYLIRNEKLIETKADRMPIGSFSVIGKEFTNHRINLQKGDVFYLFSDGFVDQFGGEKGRKYMTKRFKNFLLSIHQYPMEKQQEMINTEFDNWKGKLEQVDDVCLLGIRC